MTTTRITGLSSMATRQLLAALAAAWRQRGGAEVAFESMGGVDAANRVRAGDAFDVVVLAADAIDTLAAAGRIVPGSVQRRSRARTSPSRFAGVRRGRPSRAKTPCATPCSLPVPSAIPPARAAPRCRSSLRTGASSSAMRERLVQAPPGVPVGALLARGEVELGFQQLSELMHMEGVDVIGAMPPGLQIITTFSGGVCAASTQPEAARALLDFICSPAADEARRRHGMQPA